MRNTRAPDGDFPKRKTSRAAPSPTELSPKGAKGLSASAVRPVRPLRGRAVMGRLPVGLHPRLFIFVPAGDGRRGRAVVGRLPVGLHPRLVIFVPAGDGRWRKHGRLPESRRDSM